MTSSVSTPPVPAFAGGHETQPLRFDPTKLRGLHWGVGATRDLARGLRAALDRTATRVGER